MAFADQFAQCLANSGIGVSVDAIPDQNALLSGLASLTTWITSLDNDTQSALDEVTADFAVKVGLADQDVMIAPGLATLLQEFDVHPATISISAVIQLFTDCLQNVAAGQDQG